MKLPLTPWRAQSCALAHAGAAAARAGLWAGLGLALAAALLMPGCGGVGTGGTGTYASGPIGGFGSVLVAGVHYDEGPARVENEQGQLMQAGELRLGMTVEVEAEAAADDGQGGLSAAASRIRVVSELLGPLTALDRAAGQLVVFGLPVRLTPDTVLDETLEGALDSLEVGDVLVVYGFFDVAADSQRGAYTATRIERRGRAQEAYRLRAPVRALDLVARRAQVGSQWFDFSEVAAVPQDLAVGRFASLRVLPTPVAPAGGWKVLGFVPAARPVLEGVSVWLEGVIDTFSSRASFTLGGVEVQAAQAEVVGDPGALAAGVRVRVLGRAAAGALTAQRVELRGDDRLRADGLQLQGRIEGVDASARRLRVRGTDLFHDAATVFVGGGATDLALGRGVRVLALPAADRSRLLAQRIEFMP